MVSNIEDDSLNEQHDGGRSPDPLELRDAGQQSGRVQKTKEITENSQ